MLTGIDAAIYGVDDLDEAHRFLIDWGLTEQAGNQDARCFVTSDGTELIVRHRDDPLLPPPMNPGPTLRQLIWGATDGAALSAISARLGISNGQGDFVVDPAGLAHGVRITRRRPFAADPQEVNGPGVARRVDRRAQFYDRGRPISIGHAVLFVDDLDASLKFFLERFGFTISDSYPRHAAFLRARTPGPHHDLFILRRPGKPGLNHMAFTVSNIHEVFGAGLAMERSGWDTDLGPGRHPISSAYFWYFKSPFGGSFEYYADDDWCTEAWVPAEFERSPEMFAEWAIAGGIDGNTRRQKRAP